MRLINITTNLLEEFEDLETAPDYCIASHRWGQHEPTLESYLLNQGSNDNRHRGHKINKLCDFISDHSDFLPQFLWIDTVCIDKKSSEDVTRSINSMFKFYSTAVVCLAYLEDIHSEDQNWMSSVWFTRGWTLQELLAPREVILLKASTEIIGKKAGSGTFNVPDLNAALSQVTGIPETVLYDYAAATQLSTGEKQRWLSGRQTKFPEDMVYCMLGLHGLHMPVIYGEGRENAQRRLNQELDRDEDKEALKRLQQMFAMMQSMPGAWPGDIAHDRHVRQEKPGRLRYWFGFLAAYVAVMIVFLRGQ